MDTRSIRDIVINTHWKWIWLLEYHTDSFSKNRGIHPLTIDVLIVKLQLAGDSNIIDQVVHSIDRF